jgi:hypothetical protein
MMARFEWVMRANPPRNHRIMIAAVGEAVRLRSGTVTASDAPARKALREHQSPLKLGPHIQRSFGGSPETILPTLF